MSTTAAERAANPDEAARTRLAAKAERARVAAGVGPYPDPVTVADIERLPVLAPQLAAAEVHVRSLREERDAAIIRLMTRARLLGRASALSHAVVGFLAGGSKSLPGSVLADHAPGIPDPP